MARETKDWEWTISRNAGGNFGVENAMLSVLMDLRDELWAINSTLRCWEFQQMPRSLRSIDKKLPPRPTRAKPRHIPFAKRRRP